MELVGRMNDKDVFETIKRKSSRKWSKCPYRNTGAISYELYKVNLEQMEEIDLITYSGNVLKYLEVTQTPVSVTKIESK